jgi:hypothetical protein
VGLLIPCSKELVGSNPTPRAKLADSTNSLKYQKKQKRNIQLKDAASSAISTPIPRQTVKGEIIKEKVFSICKNQKQFIEKMLMYTLDKTEENALIICDYIIAEQNEINLRESTKEGKIKVLVDLLKFLNYKNLIAVNKNDILLYLNRYRKTRKRTLPTDG